MDYKSLIAQMQGANAVEQASGNFLTEAGNYDLQIEGVGLDRDNKPQIGVIGQNNTPYVGIKLVVVGDENGTHIGQERTERFFLTEKAFPRFYTMIAKSPKFPTIETNAEAKVYLDKEVEKNAAKVKATDGLVKFAEALVMSLQGTVFNADYKENSYDKTTTDQKTGITSTERKTSIQLGFLLDAPKYKDEAMVKKEEKLWDTTPVAEPTPEQKIAVEAYETVNEVPKAPVQETVAVKEESTESNDLDDIDWDNIEL